MLTLIFSTSVKSETWVHWKQGKGRETIVGRAPVEPRGCESD